MTERMLHHFPFDPASRQIRLALGEKRLGFSEQVERYWEQPPALARLNPSGLTPVLVERDEGVALVACETHAILEHLEERYPAPPLLARDPAQRAEARRLCQWFERLFDAEVNACLLREKMEKRLVGGGPPDGAVMHAGRHALRRHLRLMEAMLTDRDWLAGRMMSLGDFAAAAHLSVIDYFGDVPWRDFPQTKIWYMRLKSRPCFRPLLRDVLPGVPPAEDYENLDF
jgi:glutathione S-transferase